MDRFETATDQLVQLAEILVVVKKDQEMVDQKIGDLLIVVLNVTRRWSLLNSCRC